MAVKADSERDIQNQYANNITQNIISIDNAFLSKIINCFMRKSPQIKPLSHLLLPFLWLS